MRIVVTGADGFIGRNLRVRLQEAGHTDAVAITRQSSEDETQAALAGADFVFHLAGVNRPQDPADFATGNADATARLCSALKQAGRCAPLVLASSTQAALDNPYGRSKRGAETHARAYGADTGASVHVFRLTNVFGKWARPNYNSAVATFCHNRAHGMPIQVTDPSAALRLVYVDDVVDAFLRVLAAPAATAEFSEAGPVYETTVGEVAGIIDSFRASRQNLTTPRVGTGLVRALYSTYLSYLEPDAFEYRVPVHADPRGEFVEMLKTPDSGQFSYFTAHPGVTRGEHYHHTKTEKFLVIKGTAYFGFRHIVTGQTHELVTRGGEARIVETVPGWTHNITNIGDDELIVMLWANEIFDRERPDTRSMKVKP
jgi:UDP-2-acetamido-2,6-beta-L-arabino-hexul-4-ose reductase